MLSLTNFLPSCAHFVPGFFIQELGQRISFEILKVLCPLGSRCGVGRCRCVGWFWELPLGESTPVLPILMQTRPMRRIMNMISKMKRRSRARSGRALSALDLNPSLAPYPANEIPHSVRSSHCWDLKYNHCIIGDKKIDRPSLHARQILKL